MAISQRKAAVIISYATQFVHILSALLYTPLMLRVLGQSEYGTYQMVSSIVSYLGLFSLGFGSSYTKFYMRYAVKNDHEGVARLNGMFLIVFTVIAAIAGICGGFMVYNIRGFLGDGLTQEEYSTATVLMKVMILNLVLSFFSSVFDCIVTAREEFILQRTLSFFQILLNPLITLPLLLSGMGSVGMVMVSTVLAIGKFVVTVIFCLKKLHVRFSVSGLSFPLLKEIWGFTFYIFLNQILDQVSWTLDKYLLGRMSGTTAVAVYGVAGQLNSLYLQFSGSISGPFAPKINRIVARDDNAEELSRLFIKVGRLQAFLLFLFISGYILFGEVFVILWGGPEYEMSYYVGLFLMVPVTVALMQNLGIEIQRAKNKHKVRSLVYFVIAIGNVLISIPLIRRFGAVGAAAGTAVSFIPGTILFMNCYYYYALGLDIPGFWKQIGRIIVAALPAFVLGFGIWRFCRVENWQELILAASIYSAAYCLCIYLWGMNSREKEQVHAIFRRFTSSRKGRNSKKNGRHRK